MKNIINFLLISLLFACSAKKTEQTVEQKPSTTNNSLAVSSMQFQNMNLEMGEVADGEVNNEISVSGMADVPPENVATVSFPISGFIKTITHNVLPGRYIAKGGLLATIQSMEFVQLQQDYWQAVNQGDFLEKEMNRQRILASEEATAKKKVQQIESEFNANQALIKSISAKFKILGFNIEDAKNHEVQTNLPIISPISGYIKNANVSIGKNISPTEVLFEIVSKEHIHLELKVYEKDIAKVREGQKVIVNDPNLGELTGKVFLIGKTFEGENRTVNIHVHLDNEAVEAKILPGMYVNAKVLAGTRTASVLPESAILTKNGEKFIFILDKTAQNKRFFKKIKLKTGGTANGKTEVILPDGFDKKASVVLKGGNMLEAMIAKQEE